MALGEHTGVHRSVRPRMQLRHAMPELIDQKIDEHAQTRRLSHVLMVAKPDFTDGRG